MGISERECDREWLDSVEAEQQWNLRKEHTFKEVEAVQSIMTDWNEIFLDIERRRDESGEGERGGEAGRECGNLRRTYAEFGSAAAEGARKII
jgi:hypothetical protein